MKLGAIITIDEVGTPTEEVCEYGCKHRVYPVTRRSAVFIRRHQVDNLFESRTRKMPDGAVKMDVLTVVDADGQEWTRRLDGYGSVWKTADGRTAEHNYSTAPKGPTTDGFTFTFTDTTGASDVSH